MSEPAHSLWSASRFDRMIRCPGSVAVEQLVTLGKITPPNATRPAGRYAAEGTVAHLVLEHAIKHGMASAWTEYNGKAIEQDGHIIVVDDEMLTFVGKSHDNLRALALGRPITPEQRVDYSEGIGVEPGTGWGTSDAIVVRGDNLLVYDFKYGRGLKVDAPGNPQLLCYASGALALYDGIAGDFKTVSVAIDQPRLGHLSMEEYTVEELREWQRDVARPAVARTLKAREEFTGFSDNEDWADEFLHKPDEECPFCPLGAYHPRMNEVTPEADNVADPSEFGAGDYLPAMLSDAMARIPAIKAWIKAVEEEVSARLKEHLPVPGYKLVAGRMGNRKWSDPEHAESVLRRTNLKLDEVAPRSLISPTTAEKLMKADRIGPKHWAELEKDITRSVGNPIVVSSDDPRAEWQMDADEFEKL